MVQPAHVTLAVSYTLALGSHHLASLRTDPSASLQTPHHATDSLHMTCDGKVMNMHAHM